MSRMPYSRLIVALAAVAIVLGIGVLTFFLGSDKKDQKAAEKGQLQLDLSSVRGSRAAVEEVLFLRWGNGDSAASRKGDSAQVSTIETVFSSEGFVFVVDHPVGVNGARVRWFSSTGSLVGKRLAPPGSTLFRAHPGGFNYVMAKSGRKSEVAAVYRVDESSLTTFTIPLQLNSGGLFWSGSTLYAQVAPSDVDFQKETIDSRTALVPVAIDGLQVDDATADATAIDIWGFGLDGKRYTYTTHVDGLDITSNPIEVIIGSGGRRVRVPQRYKLLGVTPGSKICLSTLPPISDPTDRVGQLSAIWNSSHSPFDEVLVIGMDGKIAASIVLPYSPLAARYDDSLPISVCKDGVYTIRADEGGVHVLAYRLQ